MVTLFQLLRAPFQYNVLDGAMLMVGRGKEDETVERVGEGFHAKHVGIFPKLYTI